MHRADLAADIRKFEVLRGKLELDIMEIHSMRRYDYTC
jgi:hypothetical protein